MITNYKVVQALTLADLLTDVSAEIADGWQPSGQHVMSGGNENEDEVYDVTHRQFVDKGYVVRGSRFTQVLVKETGAEEGGAEVLWLVGELSINAEGLSSFDLTDGIWSLSDLDAGGTDQVVVVFGGDPGHGSIAWDAGTVDMTGVTVSVLDAMNIQITAPYDWVVTLLSGSTDATMNFVGTSTTSFFNFQLPYSNATSGNSFPGVSDNIQLTGGE